VKSLVIREGHHEEEVKAILELLLSMRPECAASAITEVTAILSLIVKYDDDKSEGPLPKEQFVSDFLHNLDRHREFYLAQIEMQGATLQ
jgi:hypothetical protein